MIEIGVVVQWIRLRGLLPKSHCIVKVATQRGERAGNPRTGWIECAALRNLRLDPGPVPVKPVANLRQCLMSHPEFWVDCYCAFRGLQRLCALLLDGSIIGQPSILPSNG